MPHPALQRKACAICGQVKPPSEFPWSDAAHTRLDGRCKPCLAIAATESKKRKRQADLGQKLKFMVAKLRDAQIEAPHISELAAEMSAEFGGVKELAKQWKESIDATEKGSKASLDSFSAMAKLIVMSTEHRGSAPDVAELSDEDVDQEFYDLGMRIWGAMDAETEPEEVEDDGPSAATA